MTTFSRGGWNSPERHNRRPLLCREESCLCSRGSGLSWGIQPLWGGGASECVFSGLAFCTLPHLQLCYFEGVVSSAVRKLHPANSSAGREAPWSHCLQECSFLRSLPSPLLCLSEQEPIAYLLTENEWMITNGWVAPDGTSKSTGRDTQSGGHCSVLGYSRPPESPTVRGDLGGETHPSLAALASSFWTRASPLSSLCSFSSLSSTTSYLTYTFGTKAFHSSVIPGP